MSLISRITTWASGQVLKAADLNGEFNNVVNLINNVDSATTTWTNVKTTTLNVTGTSVTLNGVLTTNASGYLIGSIVQNSQGTDATAITSVGTAFTDTNLAVSLSPKSTTHKIRISVVGRCSNLAVSTVGVYVSIFRTIGGAGRTDLSNGIGFTGISGTIAGTLEMPVGIVFLDSPASTSACRYVISVKSTTAADATWNQSLGTCIMLLEELAQ